VGEAASIEVYAPNDVIDTILPADGLWTAFSDLKGLGKSAPRDANTAR